MRNIAGRFALAGLPAALQEPRGISARLLEPARNNKGGFMRTPLILAMACLLVLALALPASAQAPGDDRPGDKSATSLSRYRKKDGTSLQKYRRTAADKARRTALPTKGDRNPDADKSVPKNQ
jgi:hypothetical protein